jgi:hypothetical protein
MKYENQWVFLSKEQIDYMLDEILPPLPQQETFVSKGSDECQFEPTTNTSSATICKHCGREKFLHTT